MHVTIADLPYRNHHSHTAVIGLYNRTQRREDNKHYNRLKPQGLWYGFKDSWLNWQNFADVEDVIEINGYLYSVTISSDKLVRIDDEPNANNVLSLQTVDECRRFYDKYRITYERLFNLPERNDELNTDQYINWPTVATDYAGIEIPYLDDKYRFDKYHEADSSFCYNWDVSSGCIWNVAAIDKFILHTK